MSKTQPETGDKTTSKEAVMTDLISYAEMLNNPKLARLYIYILRSGSTNASTIKDELGISHSTVYKYVEDLEGMGVLRREESDNRHDEFSVKPIHLEIETDESTFEITPALIDAVGRSEYNEDVRVFV
ncbi:MAG: helix-turn-helix domain-containing protein [Halobacteria archaeon]|nr:helix-turn-helix domain-containing protein [Halobacteria archaeon]